jgi:hypothetical protein
MNDNPLEAGREVEAKVRLRKPDRRQTVMVVSCPDDLAPEKHDVRRVAALVEKMDLSAFRKPIKAREGHAGNAGGLATKPATAARTKVPPATREPARTSN